MRDFHNTTENPLHSHSLSSVFMKMPPRKTSVNWNIDNYLWPLGAQHFYEYTITFTLFTPMDWEEMNMKAHTHTNRAYVLFIPIQKQIKHLYLKTIWKLNVMRRLSTVHWPLVVEWAVCHVNTSSGFLSDACVSWNQCALPEFWLGNEWTVIKTKLEHFSDARRCLCLQTGKYCSFSWVTCCYLLNVLLQIFFDVWLFDLV